MGDPEEPEEEGVADYQGIPFSSPLHPGPRKESDCFFLFSQRSKIEELRVELLTMAQPNAFISDLKA